MTDDMNAGLLGDMDANIGGDMGDEIGSMGAEPCCGGSRMREQFQARGAQVLHTVKRLIHEGNIRAITITDRNGHVLLMLPLTVGVIGVALAPMLAAVGAVAALVTECTITVVRRAAHPTT